MRRTAQNQTHTINSAGKGNAYITNNYTIIGLRNSTSNNLCYSTCIEPLDLFPDFSRLVVISSVAGSETSTSHSW